MMKQSAVEWLVNEANLLENNGWILPLIEQANKMFEQQIIQSNRDGVDMIVNEKHFITGEQYYNETFKNK